jgi:tRNA G37 N-methylase Trm5
MHEFDCQCTCSQKHDKTQPTSDWAEQRGNLLANFALGYQPIDILDSAYLAGLDASKDKIAQAKEEGRREARSHYYEMVSSEAREATITLFEEEIKRLSADGEVTMFEKRAIPHVLPAYRASLTDLLSFTDSLKKNV